MTVEGSLTIHDLGSKEMLDFVITFLVKDVIGLHPYDNDIVVITVWCDNWEINLVLIEQGSYADILY